MKISYVGNYTQQHCTEVHIAATLEKLGHEVVRIQETTDFGDDGWIDQVTGSDLFLYTRTWGNMVRLEHLAWLKERGIPSASYHLDLYVGLQREDGLDDDPFWRTDYVFTPDGAASSQAVFIEKGINHHYMKPGVFEEECYLLPSVAPISVASLAKDVVFVGGGTATGEGPQYGHKEWPYRGELIKFLQDNYGDSFGKFGWPQETIRNRDLNELYANCKVVVGDSLCLNFNHPYYWSDRVYETMGRGGFIIHPYIKGMEEEFVDGVNIVYYEYNNWDQLKEKIDYYLAHEDERERIRISGHEFVKMNCTYTQRLQQMLDTIFKPVETPTVSTDSKVVTETTDMRKKDRSRFNGLRGEIFKRDNYQCVECGMTMSDHLEKYNKSLTIDHIDGNGRNSKTPNNDPSNLQTLCLPCHGKKDGPRWMAPTPLQISLGAGTEPEEGFINLDIVALPGIDVVHNLMQYPWPFEDSSATYIKAKDVIEHMATHLPNGDNSIIAFIEECYRILAPKGTLWIQTPSWDAEFLWIDPTHVRGFDLRSFDFFDPDTDFGRGTGFYSEAKYQVTALKTENGNLQFNMVKR